MLWFIADPEFPPVVSHHFSTPIPFRVGRVVVVLAAVATVGAVVVDVMQAQAAAQCAAVVGDVVEGQVYGVGRGQLTALFQPALCCSVEWKVLFHSDEISARIQGCNSSRSAAHGVV